MALHRSLPVGTKRLSVQSQFRARVRHEIESLRIVASLAVAGLHLWSQSPRSAHILAALGLQLQALCVRSDTSDLGQQSRPVSQLVLTVQPLMPHKGEPLLDEVKAVRAWLRARLDDGSKAFFSSQKGGALSREQVSDDNTLM